MRIGYARVSTIEQDLGLQRDALKEDGCERIFEETAPGASADRPELKRALDVMRKGDTLVVWKLDSLAHSLKQLIETVNDLEAAGVKFRSITESIDTGGKLQFHIFEALAEFERSLIRERAMAGLQAARARGRKGGRPKSLDGDDVKVAERLLAAEYTGKAVAEQLGVSPSTLWRALRNMRKAAEHQEVRQKLKGFALVVNRLARERSTRPLKGKLAIAEAYNAGLRKGYAFGELEEFKKRLAAAAKEGFVELERCDVAWALPKELVEASALRLGRGVRHLIVKGGIGSP